MNFVVKMTGCIMAWFIFFFEAVEAVISTRDGGDAPENSGRIDMHAIHRQFREIV